MRGAVAIVAPREWLTTPPDRRDSRPFIQTFVLDQ